MQISPEAAAVRRLLPLIILQRVALYLPPFVAPSSAAPPSAPQASKEIVRAPQSVTQNPPSSSQAVATQSGTAPSSFIAPSSAAPPPAPQASKEITPAPQSAAQNLPAGPATEGSDPWQLHYYDPLTRDIIEWGKQFSHCDTASINAFPLRPNFKVKVIEYIDKAIAERWSRGLVVSEGELIILREFLLIERDRLVASSLFRHHSIGRSPPYAITIYSFKSGCFPVVGGSRQLALSIKEEGSNLGHPALSMGR
jgi:hypothetical protein